MLLLMWAVDDLIYGMWLIRRVKSLYLVTSTVIIFLLDFVFFIFNLTMLLSTQHISLHGVVNPFSQFCLLWSVDSITALQIWWLSLVRHKKGLLWNIAWFKFAQCFRFWTRDQSALTPRHMQWLFVIRPVLQLIFRRLNLSKHLNQLGATFMTGVFSLVALIASVHFQLRHKHL